MQKKVIIIFMCVVLTLSLGMAQNEKTTFLQKQGSATQLIVNEKPFLMLGGELGNSTASSLQDMEGACLLLQRMNLNTMLVPAYWELIEPEEGKYDFSLIDGIIHLARQHELKIVFLWFGSWKNSMSCYAPAWVKKNYKKYPRALAESGKPLEILSAFDRNNLEADKQAFVQFMKHLAATDRQQQTVIMVQVENEIGMLVNAREYGAKADELYNSDVPQQLINYLVKNKSALQPSLLNYWEKNGCKTKGKWTELFGTGLATDEIFMAWHYGLYVQEIAQAGKEVYPLPMYLNAALNSRGRKPGEYPSAGPLAHLLDIWRAAAPAIDLLAPDIYDSGFTDWCQQYDVSGNPLLIPEIRSAEANAVQALYAFGEHDAMGFSPFAIESISNPDEYPLTQSYRMLRQLLPLLESIQGKGKTNGILLTDSLREQTVNRGAYVFKFTHYYSLPWEKHSESGWPEAGVILIELADKEYLVAGTDIVATFSNTKNDGSITGILSIDEVELKNGEIIPLRRMNGDQDHQGRHLRIPSGKWSILHLKLYDYK